jgi:hypothetical protein
MNLLWYGVLRPLYALGLLVAVPLFLLMFAGGVSKEPEVTIPVLIACLLYFALGYVILVAAPRRLQAKLMSHVQTFKARGFSPQYQGMSVLFNRYLGLDPVRREALYVDVNTGTETLVGFDSLATWELAADRNRPPLLTLATRLPTLPVIDLRIGRRQSEELKAGLGALIG